MEQSGFETAQNILNVIISIVTHEYFLVFYGLMLWHLVRWWRAGNKYEKDGGNGLGFDNKKWWKLEKNDIILSLAFAPLLIIFDDEILNWYNTTFENEYASLDKWMYLLGGTVIDRIVNVLFGNKD